VKAEYVTLPVADAPTPIVGTDGHENTIRFPVRVPAGFAQFVDNFADDVKVKLCENKITAATKPAARAILTKPIASFVPRFSCLLNLRRFGTPLCHAKHLPRWGNARLLIPLAERLMRGLA